MIIHGGRALLHYEDLVNDRVLSRDAYHKAAQRGQITLVRKGGDGHPALIDWASLADRYKEMVRHHLGGDPEDLARTRAIEEHMTLAHEDATYIDTFRGGNGLMLSEQRRSALKRAARVLSFMVELHGMTPEQVQQAYGQGTMELKGTLLKYIKAHKVDLPKSFARLEAKKRAYLQAREEGHPGATALIHGGQGNKNSKRLIDPLQQAALELLASRHQNFSWRHIASQYNAIAQGQGWPTLTANTVANYLSKGAASRTTTLWGKGRAAYQRKHGIVIHRSGPSSPTYLWAHDATDYELYFQREDGGRRTYHHRKKVVVVLDAHSWYPVGYAIGDTDTVELSKEAVKNAVDHMLEVIGAYVLPYQVQSDRLGWKQLGDWYDGMGVKYTPAAARNARSKVIEPWFRHHHEQFVQPFCENWGGHNITASVERQPNPDALEHIKKEFPDEANVIAQIHQAMARNRAATFQRFSQGLKAMEPGMLKVIDRARFLELFGVQHPWTNELTNRGLCPTIHGEERPFNLLTVEFQDRIGAAFQVVYDPADLRDVLAIEQGSPRRYLVPAFERVPMALADHTPQTRLRLDGIEAFKKELGQAAIDQRRANAERILQVATRVLEGSTSEAIEGPRELEPSPEEEAVVRGYFIEGGSHKAALRNAKRKPEPPAYDDSDDVERRALEAL